MVKKRKAKVSVPQQCNNGNYQNEMKAKFNHIRDMRIFVRVSLTIKCFDSFLIRKYFTITR
ncbi:hypothetical protein PIROE2DRAFT_15551 [Piromyces sp. E2]|nr:hypothetical protein PIROE2DRAFT_15551 [Piromyces sp. E2]|eukprot:OUM59036.1 hypothetical protein PIROE2DRAFT_15551 [Piromyces sp. E2]